MFGSLRYGSEAFADTGRAMREGDVELAVAAIDRAAAYAPNEPQVHLARAQVLHKANRRDEARRELRCALLLAPDDPDVALLNAEDLDSTDHADDAAEIVLAAAARHPENEELVALAALHQLRIGRAPAALGQFDALITQADKSGSPYRVVARIGRAAATVDKDLPAAVADVTRACEIDLDAAVLAVETLGSAGLDDALRKVARVAFEAKPESTDLATLNAYILHRSGKNADALAAAQVALPGAKSDRAWCRLQLITALAKLSTDDRPGGLAALDALLDRDPSFIDALLTYTEALSEGASAAERDRLRGHVERATDSIRDPRVLRDLASLARRIEAIPVKN